MNENPDNELRMNYWQDTVDCWHRLPNKAFFFVLLAAWLAAASKRFEAANIEWTLWAF
jgi:hypothetical protein